MVVSSLIRSTEPQNRTPQLGPWIFAGVVAIATIAFLVLPGEISQKSRTFLHGLCAQRASHSFRMGENVLPVDARMTGIYLGAAVTIAWLALSGRLRAAAPIPRRVVAVMGLFVAVMAGDGFNSLLVDLDLPKLYAPSNLLRFATGSLAGSALGVMVGYLFATTIWRNRDRERAVVGSLWHLVAPLVATALVGVLVAAGPPELYAPIAASAVVASVGAFWMIGMVLAALLTNRAWSFGRVQDVAGLAAVGLVAAVAIIAGLAALRFAAEMYLGLPQLT